MIVCLNNGNVPKVPDCGGYVLLTVPESRRAALDAAGIPALLTEAEHSQATRYDSHDQYDYFAILLPDFTSLAAAPALLEGYLACGRLVLVLPDTPAFAPLRADLAALEEEKSSPAHVLYLLLARILARDIGTLEDMEDEIELLEEKAVKPQPEDCTAAMIVLRKRLLAFQRYYEFLFDALEDLCENQNGFFSKQGLRPLEMQKNKADRLKNNVNHLREYLTQVREAYQNQLDISLNQTMRVFTVITAIFLPLTLIAGWYGMNLDMPEYASPATYPVVIALSLVIVAWCLWLFRKKKWF